MDALHPVLESIRILSTKELIDQKLGDKQTDRTCIIDMCKEFCQRKYEIIPSVEVDFEAYMGYGYHAVNIELKFRDSAPVAEMCKIINDVAKGCPVNQVSILRQEGPDGSWFEASFFARVPEQSTINIVSEHWLSLKLPGFNRKDRIRLKHLELS